MSEKLISHKGRKLIVSDVDGRLRRNHRKLKGKILKWDQSRKNKGNRRINEQNTEIVQRKVWNAETTKRRNEEEVRAQN